MPILPATTGRQLNSSLPVHHLNERCLALLAERAQEDDALSALCARADRIASEEVRHLKARWPESRSFWKELLEAAIGTDDQALVNVHHLPQLGSCGALPHTLQTRTMLRLAQAV